MRTAFLLLLFPLLASAQTLQVPEILRIPAGQHLTYQARGVGVQVYVCTRTKENLYAWVFRAPEANLLDRAGKTVGKHFAGPTWQADDGSLVMGKPVATLDSPDAQSVPWLVLKTTKNEGAGVLSEVLSIQRLNTKGGKPPASGCDSVHEQQVVRIPYEADYYFYSAPAKR